MRLKCRELSWAAGHWGMTQMSFFFYLALKLHEIKLFKWNIHVLSTGKCIENTLTKKVLIANKTLTNIDLIHFSRCRGSWSSVAVCELYKWTGWSSSVIGEKKQQHDLCARLLSATFHNWCYSIKLIYYPKAQSVGLSQKLKLQPISRDTGSPKQQD